MNLDKRNPVNLPARILRGLFEIALISGIITLFWHGKPLAVFAGLLFAAALLGKAVGR